MKIMKINSIVIQYTSHSTYIILFSPMKSHYTGTFPFCIMCHFPVLQELPMWKWSIWTPFWRLNNLDAWTPYRHRHLV